MSLEQFGSGPSPAEVNGGNVTSFDRFYAYVEKDDPLDEADLKIHASRILPGMAQRMRNWRTGPSEARTHALPTIPDDEPERNKVRMRREKTRLRHDSRGLPAPDVWQLTEGL